jgi:hypothetical protein
VLSLFCCCQQKIEPSDVAKLNGYWEIEKFFDKGEDKDYSINVNDYFEIGKKKGIRKKNAAIRW